MVTAHLIDRVQAYVAVTRLRQPHAPATPAGAAASMLADMWDRARQPDQAHADTAHPLTAFAYAA